MVWLRRAGIVLLVLIGGAAFVLWFLLQRSLPDYDATVTATGLGDKVEIIRTEHAIPHIFAMSDPDVFFGLGYAPAQDRMFQMELLRRTAKGRLSEMLGTPTIATDELLLRLGLYNAAEASLSAQSEETLAALQAYAAGVNARINEVEGYGTAAPEFLLFPVDIAEWQPADSLAILKLLALQLASQIDKEVTRARVMQVLPPERLADILPDSPTSSFVNAPQQEAHLIQPNTYPVVQRPRTEQAWLHPAAIWPDGMASNAWLAAPSRSSTGASILANDTHLNFGAPTVWYLARLEMESGPVLGSTIPGAPMVLSGMSQHIAWGLTAANMDDQDVFIERLSPDNAAEVLTPQGF
jgi:penicillin amidase